MIESQPQPGAIRFGISVTYFNFVEMNPKKLRYKTKSWKPNSLNP